MCKLSEFMKFCKLKKKNYENLVIFEIVKILEVR